MSQWADRVAAMLARPANREPAGEPFTRADLILACIAATPC
jgi:hypothetical protein